MSTLGMPSRIGIVGNGTDKFTAQGKRNALAVISDVLGIDDTLVSGHSPVGGIDIWAEDFANQWGIATDIKTPEVNQWNPSGGYGYKARNLDIARTSDEVHVILADVYPKAYHGRRFEICYHCARAGKDTNHIKSGGCWTGIQAEKAGVLAIWHVVRN